MKVPFNKPVWLPEITASIEQAMARGHLSGVGPLTRQSEQVLHGLGLERALLVSSGSHALEMCALLADVQPGDEVILPSYTFVSTANAFVLRGAVLRFADNDVYGNITLAEIQRLTTPRTKAVMVVHYAGASADMDPIMTYCREKKLTLLEDAAQSIGATYKGRPVGTSGMASAFSFHETKNVTSGEGGALWVDSDVHKERAEILREKGTNRTQFFLGLADKYTWVDIGSSYVLSELNVAYLTPQLSRLKEINARRVAIRDRYIKELTPAVETMGARFLGTPAHNVNNGHMCALVLPTADTRTAFIAAMRADEITTPFHYLSLHASPFGQSWSKRHGVPIETLPECERLSGCLVRLPLYFNMSDAEQSYVIERIARFFKR